MGLPASAMCILAFMKMLIVYRYCSAQCSPGPPNNLTVHVPPILTTMDSSYNSNSVEELFAECVINILSCRFATKDWRSGNRLVVSVQ